jgi:homoprotocatechuate degradation regulator HpaR
MSAAEYDRPATPMRRYDYSLPLLLLKAREVVMSRFVPVLRSENISPEQWRVLRVLMESDHVDATTLAERGVLMMPSLSRMLRSLEQRALISRKSDPEDQRRSLISISGKGRQLFERLAPVNEMAYAEIEATLGEERLERLYQLLSESIELLDDNEKDASR